MGEKNSDGGQFFTPREVIRAWCIFLIRKLEENGLRSLLRHRRIFGGGV